MAYKLFIADRSFSSWSLRGWLMLEKFNLPFTSQLLNLYDGSFAQDIAPLAPARLVPVLRCPDGTLIGETLAIAEELNSRHPEAGMWPSDPKARSFARWISAEMHAGFTTLRNDCPMQLLHQYQNLSISPALKADLARIEDLWHRARDMAQAEGPWLFGRYSLADAFFAPVAARIAGYDLPVGPLAQTYVDNTLQDPAFRRWRAFGLLKTYDPVPYAMALDTRPWPGPAPRAARAVESGPAENNLCPYSGKPATDFLELEGKVYGFCNPTCRDKTVLDPEAWPDFMALVRG